MPLTTSAYALLGLTAIVAALVAVVVFALLRFMVAARDTRRRGKDPPLLSAALQEAVAKLKAQERATARRADASERLSERDHQQPDRRPPGRRPERRVRILNPAGRRMLGVADNPGSTTTTACWPSRWRR